MGEITAHRAPFHHQSAYSGEQRIWGAAVASGTAIVVDEVNADPRYLSCPIQTKSEIVVASYANGIVVRELDIDSYAPTAFTSADRLFLEEAARSVGQYMEE
jgi:L-methionine (R)-S-oxide reductase